MLDIGDGFIFADYSRTINISDSIKIEMEERWNGKEMLRLCSGASHDSKRVLLFIRLFSRRKLTPMKCWRLLLACSAVTSAFLQPYHRTTYLGRVLETMCLTILSTTYLSSSTSFSSCDFLHSVFSSIKLSFLLSTGFMSREYVSLQYIAAQRIKTVFSSPS